MKPLPLLTLTALLGFSGPGQAETADYDTLATMETLADSGTLVGNVVFDRSYTGTVYSFDGESAITDITNAAIADKIAGGSGYLTIAAWVCNRDGTASNIFSTGGQSNGFKLDLRNDSLLFTTKGVADTHVSAATVARDEWTLVGVCLNLTGSGNSLLYDGEHETRHYTRQLGGWNTANPATFAIASGNSNGIRLDSQGRSEAFRGSIANLTVLYSDDLLSNAAVAQAVGATPQAIPEPHAALLSLLALAGLAAYRRRLC